MVLKYHISPVPALLEDMVVKIYEAQNEAAEVHSEDLLAPHNAPRTVIVNGLDTVVHIVRLYTKDTVALLHEYNVEPYASSLTLFDLIQFKIGDGGALTPAAGTNSYTNPILIGMDPAKDFVVTRNNYGVLFYGIHFDFDAELGEITLKLEDDQFGENEEITIEPRGQVGQTPVNDSVVGKWFGGFVDVAVHTSYIPSHLRKLIRLNGTPTYTFAADGQVPIGYGFCFQHYGATNGPAKVQFLNGALRYGASDVTELSIARNSEACFVFDGTKWNVVYFTGNDETGATTPVAGTVLGAGNRYVGDVPGGDPIYEVIHNLNIEGDYTVILSIKSDVPANYHRNNRITHTWWHHTTNKANRFMASLQELSAEPQSLHISWIIIKL